MNSNLFSKKHTRQEEENPAHDLSQQDMYWRKEIEETMKLGYSYEVARGIVSKRKIQELFEKDRKINWGR